MTDHQFDPRPYERSNAAWQAAAALMADGTWHSLASLRPVMCAAGDLKPQSATKLLLEANKDGVIQKRCGRKQSRYYRIHPQGAARFLELTRATGSV